MFEVPTDGRRQVDVRGAGGLAGDGYPLVRESGAAERRGRRREGPPVNGRREGAAANDVADGARRDPWVRGPGWCTFGGRGFGNAWGDDGAGPPPSGAGDLRAGERLQRLTHGAERLAWRAVGGLVSDVGESGTAVVEVVCLLADLHDVRDVETASLEDASAAARRDSIIGS